MRRVISIALVAAACWGVVAQGGRQQPQQEESKLVDLKADVVYPIEWRDTTVFCLVGNFAAHHNGAVITCDSAVRYSDKRIECFGNVLINKNTTYVYGDRADYNGEINEARVYSDIVKVVDGDATLYTYRFSFNTLDNIGTFGGGGVVVNRDNTMESQRGYYYADLREVICVEEVEMRNDTYQMTGDSVVYNLATDRAQYFRNTNIWNDKGEYLYADRGTYEKPQDRYTITENGYILTEKQELWSDSLDYFRAEEHAVLRHDIQIDDTDHTTLAFGDYGEYWKEPGNVLLTRRPSVINYDPREIDSLFMRADTIYIYTLFGSGALDTLDAPDTPDAPDAAGTAVVAAAADSVKRNVLERDSVSMAHGGHALAPDSLSDGHPLPAAVAEKAEDAETEVAERGANGETGASEGGETAVSETGDASGETDAAASERGEEVAEEEPAPEPELTKEERKAKLREQAEKEKAEKRAAAAAKRKIRDEEIIAKRKAKLLKQKEKDEARLERRRAKAEAKMQQRRERAARKGKPFIVDSTELRTLDSLIVETRSEKNALLDELAAMITQDSLEVDTIVLPLWMPPGDSMWRMVKGYRDVRIYRSDFQSVCDSLVAFSSDSTIHLYIDPVLWNETNQITSEVMDLYVENQQLKRGEFVGTPLMVSQLDTMYYNQVTGKEMTAFFRDNQIYRNDVNGNAQTLYYMQEDGSPEVIGLMVIESGSMTFYIEDKQIDGITYRGNPTYTIYPMDKIPETQELFLKVFKWENTRRPTRGDVFDRRLRPSQREEKSRLPRPRFPILERLERRKAMLIERGRWADRNDVLTPEVEEWMHSLGY